MAQVLARTSATDYVAANFNRSSRGDNGTDHVVVRVVAVAPARELCEPATTSARASGAPVSSAPVNGGPVSSTPKPADPAHAEGFSSAAGLGFALVLSAGVGLVGIVAAVARALFG